MTERKGKLVLIEWTDWSGKQTQTKLLEERLRADGKLVEVFSFPRYNTPTGQIVWAGYLGKKSVWDDIHSRILESGIVESNGNSLFDDPLNLDPKIASLYYAADRRYAKKDIEAALEINDVVILDRYVESNMAHQGSKIFSPQERKSFYEWIHSLEYDLLELPQPDISFFLFMPYQVSKELRKGRLELDVHESDDDHLKNAEQAYLQLVELYRWTKINSTIDWTISTLKTIGQIHEEIYWYVLKK